MAKTILPLASVERILRNAGAKRVSKSATKEFTKHLEELATTIAADATKLAAYSGRKTITESDILLAKKQSNLR
jgi:histone H3/H4